MHRLVFVATRSRPKVNVGRCTASRGIYFPSRRLLSTSQKPPRDTGAPRQTDRNSNGGADSTKTSPPPDLDALGVPPSNFARPTLTALNFWFRFAKFSLIGIAVLAGGTFAGLEGTHLWVEHYGLAEPSDPDGELARWGWTKEAERWSGGTKGGTDPALSGKARYAIRSAWMAQHWGTGEQIISDSTLAQAQQNANKAIEARLEFSHDFLSIALSLAEESAKAGKPLRPETINELLVRKASTLERIGSKGALYDARASYERVWDTQLELNTDTEERARLALKLGDVNARLGDSKGARSWWSQALQLASSPNDSASGGTSDTITESDNPSLPTLPRRLPDSPHAQRTIAAAVSSLSAFLAQSGQLADAKAVQEDGIKLVLRPIIAYWEASRASSSTQEHSQSIDNETPGPPQPDAKRSAPQSLHNLFLQHRLSLFELHRAEVNYALKYSSPEQTLKDLARAAAVAEDVIYDLNPSPPSTNTDSSSSSPDKPIANAQLDKFFSQDRVLKGPAGSLLRDARRTALHAWTLSGILHENAASSTISSQQHFPTSSQTPLETSASLWGKLFSRSVPPSSPSVHQQHELEQRDAERCAALRCYGRALKWAGADDSVLFGEYQKGEEPQPSREMLPGEWKTLWEGYVRTRDAVFASVDNAIAQKEKDGEKKP